MGLGDVYKVLTHKDADKYIKSQPRKVQDNVQDAIDHIKEDPHGALKRYGKNPREYKAHDGLFLWTVAYIRLVYSIDDDKRIVHIIDADKRGDMYRD
jgi:mRNA-degrading endonuclease RelE of RelBE toxin-antitoxin system